MNSHTSFSGWAPLFQNVVVFDFSSAGWVIPISLSKCCLSVSMCLDVNQGGTNRNRCAKILEILDAQTY